MIYLDSSVVLSRLLAEDRSPPETLADAALVSSRLLEYEIWNRLPDNTIAQLDRSVLAKYLPAQLSPAAARRPEKAKASAAVH